MPKNMPTPALKTTALRHLPDTRDVYAEPLGDLSNSLVGDVRGKAQLVVVTAAQRETQRILCIHQSHDR